jgi:hypothetical protein
MISAPMETRVKFRVLKIFKMKNLRQRHRIMNMQIFFTACGKPYV